MPLQEHIVFIWVFVMVRVFNSKDVVPETWDHKQLLVKTIHVADTAEVFYSNVACCRLFIVIKLDVPICILLCPPRDLSAKLTHVVKNNIQLFDRVSAYCGKQVKGCFSRVMAFAFWSGVCSFVAMRDLKETFVNQVMR